MADDYLFGPIDCACTGPHGGKLWLCDTEACELNKKQDEKDDHPETCCCEVCRFWS